MSCLLVSWWVASVLLRIRLFAKGDQKKKHTCRRDGLEKPRSPKDGSETGERGAMFLNVLAR